ncbi:cytochrome c oxidase subunit 2A [Ectobacillus ponti]|uniref:Cytochrome c oxidase subunit 2A n=1 Tax=Ectobacillus ponti TaxID=2961894 RepID=A0AA41XB54_9BACI|nr:cytochrome c oxidase subunit 2A [Ectobacillus ponti]MCP8968806.1 cytochrome c oxidase subunit 2A [Ectobacillus ponti]
MAKPELAKGTKVESQSSLKGTLTAVFLLGAFLIFTWLSVYAIFIERL